MPAALVVAHGPTLYLILPDRDRATPFRSDSPSGPGSRPGADSRPESLPKTLLQELERLPAGHGVVAGGAPLTEALSQRLGRAVVPASEAEWRRALRLIPETDGESEGEYLREVAGTALEHALESPEEVLITLAREEERLERVVGREERAAESLLAVPVRVVTTYADRGKAVRGTLARHHAELLASLEATANEVVPNLSALVGPRVAARLVAAAGGVVPLARFSAGRIQLLGTRRRPDPDRGPRYGLLYRADRLSDVLPPRRAAYARSLAAMAAIAVRADAWTRATIGPQLRARRDRRIERLNRGGGR